MNRRVIVKVGTKVLSSAENTLDTQVLRHIVEQIALLKKHGLDVILVTSGAMGAGRGLITIKNKEDKVAERQVLAAVGQAKLMSEYSAAFSREGLLCAQVLATKEDFRDKTHYFNMRTCFENLLANNVVPVVNENDVVATTELLFTDNDELAGLVASQLNAETCIILTSVEGFLTGDPADPASQVIPVVDFKDATGLQKYISSTKTAFGRGGMLTKFMIAKKLTTNGITVYFANGKREGVLTDILVAEKAIGTRFAPHTRSSALKRRIAYSSGLTKGAVMVNRCAEELLVAQEKIMSLLPVGIVRVNGDFAKGDIIEITGETGRMLGYGVAEYGSERARALVGKKQAKPVIHYNHMFIGV
jgi:glutamate 5-kinase